MCPLTISYMYIVQSGRTQPFTLAYPHPHRLPTPPTKSLSSLHVLLCHALDIVTAGFNQGCSTGHECEGSTQTGATHQLSDSLGCTRQDYSTPHSPSMDNCRYCDLISTLALGCHKKTFPSPLSHRLAPTLSLLLCDSP